MTVSSTKNHIEYSGDGATQTFPVPFYFILNSDIGVTISDPDGNLTELYYGVDYSATGGGNPDGGSVIINKAYDSKSIILIYRNPPETQETKYYENGKFPARSHEAALDKLTMLIQKYGWQFDSLALSRPGFFSKYYDAKGLRISNLADPKNDQDAATQKWALNEIAKVVSASSVDMGSLSDTTSDSLGDALIGVRQPYAGAAARTQHDKNTDAVSVKDFGAKGDGLTDDSAAIQAAANAGFLYFPPGVFIVSQEINLPDDNVTIFGEGVGSTEIRYTGYKNLFKGDFSNSITTFQVSDLSITTDKSNVGTGIRLSWPEDFDHGWTPRFFATNVIFRGALDYLDGFNSPVYLSQCDNASFLNCGFKGVGGDPSNFTQDSNTVSQYGVRIDGRFSPVEFKFTNCFFYCLKTSVAVGDTAEGVYFHNCTMVEVYDGIVWNTGYWSSSYPSSPGANASGRPLLSVIGCHINCFNHAVATNGVVSIHVSDNLFYFSDRAKQTGNLIQIINSNDGAIHDNELWSFNSAYGCNGLLLSDNVRYMNAHDNRIVSAVDNGFLTGVTLQSGARDNVVLRTTGRGKIKTSLILDLGQRNAIGRRGGYFSQTSNFTVSSGNRTVVNLNTTSYDSDGIWSGSGGALKVPDGVYRIRLSGGVNFNENPNGYREIAIYKNGGIYMGMPSATCAAITGASNNMNISSGVLSVTPGDLFDVRVFQNSGSDIQLQGGLSWFSMEIMD